MGQLHALRTGENYAGEVHEGARISVRCLDCGYLVVQFSDRAGPFHLIIAWEAAVRLGAVLPLENE